MRSNIFVINMKTENIILIMLFLLALPLRGDQETYRSVNALLPKDERLWPIPKPDAPIIIETTWSSGDEILKIRNGDWFRIWSLFEYKVIKVQKGEFASDSLRFIVQHEWPTPESGIVIKGLPMFFTPETKAIFYLRPRGTDKTYEIQSYEIDSKMGKWQYKAD